MRVITITVALAGESWLRRQVTVGVTPTHVTLLLANSEPTPCGMLLEKRTRWAYSDIASWSSGRRRLVVRIRAANSGGRGGPSGPLGLAIA